MRFSVLTITFNAEAYLTQTLQSVAGQIGVDFEHIIWDGGSRDRTLEIAESFPHVKIFQGKDSGIADAMNRVVQYATGEFILHLHADDLLSHPKALLMADRALRLHPGVEWLYGRVHFINEEGEKLRTSPYELYSAKRLKKYNFISHPATIVSRSLFLKSGGFKANLRYCMDYDLWLRLSYLATPYVLSAPLACFREHTRSLSTSEPIGVADEAYSVRNGYINSPYGRFRSYLTWKKRRQKYLKAG